MALADRAAQAATPEGDKGPSGFKKPDISQFVPPDMIDPVQRTVAAGMKIMYSPDMRDEMQAALQSQEPIPKRIADNTLGLLLTLDGKTQGGIPAAALFPVALELAAECAEVLENAGQPVAQQDFNDALLALYAMVGKKLGASDDALMQSAQQAVGQPMTGEPGAPPQGPPGAPPGAVPPPQGVPA